MLKTNGIVRAEESWPEPAMTARNPRSDDDERARIMDLLRRVGPVPPFSVSARTSSAPPPPRKRFRFDAPVALGLLLVVPPLGLTVLWSSDRYGRDAKWALTIATVIFLLTATVLGSVAASVVLRV